MRDPDRGPWIDMHAHPGRTFLAGLASDHPLSALLGGEAVGDAVAAARDAGMTAIGLATVADLLVLGPDAEGGLHAMRDFRLGEAFADHQRQLDGLVAVTEGAGARIARRASDIEGAHAEDAIAVMLSVEGGDFLEGDVGRLVDAHAVGLSSLTLVHYRVNDIGDIQTEPPVHGGLTPFGREVVAEANRLGLLIDCAHATFDVTRQVIDTSTQPVMVSHSHLDHADRHHPRLLSDDHARVVADAGGLIGAWPAGVTSATLDDFIGEVMRLIDLIGVDHVAIGTDMDANYKPVLDAYSQFAALAGGLSDRGLTTSDVDQIMGGNALELFRRVCG
jgi:membrane dipeptidase